MPGNEGGIAAERPKPLRDGINQLLMIAARKIRSAYRSLKQYIPDNRQVGWRVMKNNMARRVAGTMDDIQRQIANRHRIAMDKPAVGLKCFGVHPIFLAIIAQLRDPEAIILMRAFNWHTQFLGEQTCLPTMIEMPVGDDDLFNRHPMVIRRGAQPGQIPARIAKRAFHGLGAPDQGAILLERGDRHDGGLHGGIDHPPALTRSGAFVNIGVGRGPVGRPALSHRDGYRPTVLGPGVFIGSNRIRPFFAIADR